MAELRAASARIDVTPQAPLPLAGYAGRTGAFTHVHDRLELNAMRLEVYGRTIVLLTIDSLSFSQELEHHCRALAPAGAIVFGVASHTHYAPAIDAHVPTLGGVDAGYRAYVFAQAAKLMAELFAAPLLPAQLRWGEAQAHHSINRRRRAWRPGRKGLKCEMCLLPNPHGLRDDTLRLLLLETTGGMPLAALWSYACHAVSFFDEHAVSADYPGVVRAGLRGRIGDVPCLFWPGLSGNTRPNRIAPLRGPKPWLRYLLQGRFFGGFDEDGWKAWTASLAAVALAALDHMQPVALAAPRFDERTIPYDVLQTGVVHTQRPQPQIARLVLGELTLLLMNGEPVLEWRHVLNAPGRYVLHTGYRGHLFGYWPTSRIVAEGGYEADGFRPAFDLPGRYRPDIDARVMALLKDADR